MPANRGIVCRGVYRLMRHPIYLGYFVTHIAFVAANASLEPRRAPGRRRGAGRLGAVRGAGAGMDPAYREYQVCVRWRVFPESSRNEGMSSFNTTPPPSDVSEPSATARRATGVRRGWRSG